MARHRLGDSRSPGLPYCSSATNSVRITYYGHSCFEFNYEGLRILVDPFTPELFDYQSPEGRFDIVFSTHNAKDHAYFDALSIGRLCLASGATDTFEIIEADEPSIRTGSVIELFGEKRLSCWTVPSFHDEVQGQRNGVNGIICLDFSGIRIVHLGDIGHVLEEAHIDTIGAVDVLMVPVDSYYIIGLDEAREIVDQLSPAVTIPMHYKTVRSRSKALEEDLDHFAGMFESVREHGGSNLEVTRDGLNIQPQLLILAYLRDRPNSRQS